MIEDISRKAFVYNKKVPFLNKKFADGWLIQAGLTTFFIETIILTGQFSIV